MIHPIVITSKGVVRRLTKQEIFRIQMAIAIERMNQALKELYSDERIRSLLDL